MNFIRPTKRISSFVSFLHKLKPKFPEKWKGGRMEKLANYLHHIYGDYAAVAVETVQDMKNKPMKSSLYASLLTSAVILYKTNPTEQNLRTKLINESNELMLVGESIRNPKSDEHIQIIVKALKDGKLRYISLGLFSLLVMSEFSESVDVYESQCRQLKPHWKDFHKHIVDIGVFGRWIYIHKAMADYDVNPEEWTDDGKQKNIIPAFQPFTFEEKNKV